MLAQRYPNVSKQRLNQCWPNVGPMLTHICITEIENVTYNYVYWVITIYQR